MRCRNQLGGRLRESEMAMEVLKPTVMHPALTYMCFTGNSTTFSTTTTTTYPVMTTHGDRAVGRHNVETSLWKDICMRLKEE